MNIFVLDNNPKLCAQYHVDKHVNKMILESAQMLCTAHRELNPCPRPGLYKDTHKNHPCSVWVRQSNNNYIWLFCLFKELSKEFEHRFDHSHKTWNVLGDILNKPPSLIPVHHLTLKPVCMPDEYKISTDPVLCYREYYRKGKNHIHQWTKRDVPEWL